MASKNEKLKGRKIHSKYNIKSNIENTIAIPVKKVRERKVVKAEFEETKEDIRVETEDTVSLVVAILVLIACAIIGIILGYVMYKLAISTSATIMAFKSLLG